MSLPTKQVAQDPHEKPDRYLARNRSSGLLAGMKDSVMFQSQRTRWVKTAVIVVSLVFLFLWLSPRGVEVYRGGELALFQSRAIADKSRC